MPGRAPRATPLAHISGHARIREGSPLSIRGRPTGTLRRRARNQRRPFTRSRSALSGSFAFTTPDESRTPTVPSSNAFATSLRAFTPAPQSTLTFGFAACMRSTAFVMTSGFAVVTLTSPPISSGGSIAMYSGESFARVSASTRSSAQAITSRPSFWHRGMLFAISSHATLRSLWLISVPAAPASRRASGGIHPVVGPGSTASTCWLNTGRWTSFAMCARSDVGGTRTIDAPVPSATAAKRFASSQPLFPRISGYVLRFKTMAGFRTAARMALPSEIGLALRLSTGCSEHQEAEDCCFGDRRSDRREEKPSLVCLEKVANGAPRCVEDVERRHGGLDLPPRRVEDLDGCRSDDDPVPAPFGSDDDGHDLEHLRVADDGDGDHRSSRRMLIDDRVGDGLEHDDSGGRGGLGDDAIEDSARSGVTDGGERVARHPDDERGVGARQEDIESRSPLGHVPRGAPTEGDLDPEMTGCMGEPSDGRPKLGRHDRSSDVPRQVRCLHLDRVRPGQQQYGQDKATAWRGSCVDGSDAHPGQMEVDDRPRDVEDIRFDHGRNGVHQEVRRGRVHGERPDRNRDEGPADGTDLARVVSLRERTDM